VVHRSHLRAGVIAAACLSVGAVTIPSVPSTGSVGDAYDNAMCESFFATRECELIDRRRFRSHGEARMAVFRFIEGFYNPSRRPSALGYLSPIEYERKHDRLSKPA
jgi:putative transposase